MINFKKGPALSLHQVNYIGKAKTGQGVIAGMVVEINESGEVVKATSAGDATDKAKLYGFAINTQDSGDVIESGAIGVYALDGASVIETDQTAASITTTNYPIGDLVAVEDGTGKIKKVATGASDRAIGQVEGIRTLPGVTQTINGIKVQGSTTVVAIKLFS